MVSILIASVPIHGHVTAMLDVARHFVERGDDVRFLTGARFADAVTATGARHLPLPEDADYDDRQDWNEVFPARAGLSGARAVAFDVEHVFVRPGRAQHDAVMAAHNEEPVDVLLTDPVFAGTAYVLGHPRAERPPVVVCGVLPLIIQSRDTALFGSGITPMRGPVGRLRNRLLSEIARRTVFASSSQVADRVSRELFDRALDFPVLDWPRHAEAIAQFTVPRFEYPRSDAPPTLEFVGPLSATGSQAPLPDWWDDLDDDRPIVHVTQGTLANRDFSQLVGPTLEGLAADDVWVVVTAGGRPVEALPPLPANARGADYLPYDELLPRTDVVVTNGGYGGVQYTLRHGVPLVVSGGQEDKPEVAARVAWSGVGRRLRSERPSASAVGAAVRAVLADPSYRARAQQMARDMAASPGLARLERIVDDLAR